MSDFTSAPFAPLPPRFYHHSGKVPAAAAVFGLVASVGAAIVLGAVFGGLEFASHLIPEVKLSAIAVFLLLLGFAVSLGFVPMAILTRFKSRSVPAALLLTAITCLIAYYTAWVSWIFSYYLYFHHFHSPLLIGNPTRLFHLISAFVANGTWSLLEDLTPKGVFLVLIWIAEFGIIAGLALRIAYRRAIDKVFCEHCDSWGTCRPLMQIRPTKLDDLKSNLIAGRLEVLSTATPSPPNELTWCDIVLEGCPTCDNLQTLNLDHTTLIPKKNGSKKTTRKLIRRLVLTPEQTAQIALAAAALKAPPPAADPA